MTTAPDPTMVRKIAREYILDAGQNADDISTYVWVRVGADLTKHEHGAWCSAIRQAIRTATVTWPDEQPRDERDGDVRAVESVIRAWSEADIIEDLRYADQAVRALDVRFADRIAALDAKAGE